MANEILLAPIQHLFRDIVFTDSPTDLGLAEYLFVEASFHIASGASISPSAMHSVVRYYRVSEDALHWMKSTLTSGWPDWFEASANLSTTRVNPDQMRPYRPEENLHIQMLTNDEDWPITIFMGDVNGIVFQTIQGIVQRDMVEKSAWLDSIAPGASGGLSGASEEPFTPETPEYNIPKLIGTSGKRIL